MHSPVATAPASGTQPTSNLRIRSLEPLVPPARLCALLPLDAAATRTIVDGRRAVERILAGDDPRLLAVVGPCSIHDLDGARDYARRLQRLAGRVGDRLLVVMRVYFEKPRTTVGWKGLINDPHLDDTFDVATGLRLARNLLIEIAQLGLPTATEFLEPITPQYIADTIVLGAIGARTTESPTHRQMASGLSMPVGFKNSTDGSLQAAIDAMQAARPARIVVDCSHANSGKDHRRQSIVWRDVLEQRIAGDRSIMGMMLESNINPGSQPPQRDRALLAYGVSITDGCIGWDETEELLLEAHRRLA